MARSGWEEIRHHTHRVGNHHRLDRRVMIHSRLRLTGNGVPDTLLGGEGQCILHGNGERDIKTRKHKRHKWYEG